MDNFPEIPDTFSAEVCSLLAGLQAGSFNKSYLGL